MKKPIVIIASILLLSLGLFLKRQHHSFKENAKKSNVLFQEMIDDQYRKLSEDRLRLKEYQKDYSGSNLIKSQEELIKIEESCIDTLLNRQIKLLKDSEIGFIFYSFMVFPKEAISYFK